MAVKLSEINTLCIDFRVFILIRSTISRQCYMIANKFRGMQSGQSVTVPRIPNTHLSKMQHLAPFNLYSWNVTSLINASSRYVSEYTARSYDLQKHTSVIMRRRKASCHCVQLNFNIFFTLEYRIELHLRAYIFFFFFKYHYSSDISAVKIKYVDSRRLPMWINR